MVISALDRCAAVARSKPALVAGALLTALFFVFQTTRFRARNLALTADASIVYEKSLSIWENGLYPAHLALANFNEVFPYPPPAVVLFALLSKLGATTFHVVWLTMMAAGMVASFFCVAVNEPKETRRTFIALMLPVIALTSNPIIHDLSNHNNNLIILGFAMVAFALMSRHPLWAGAVLALPIALKLYVAAVLVWVLAYRPRALISCGAGLAALAALPPITFGWEGALALFRGWLEQVAIVDGAWVYALTPETGGPPLIALRRAAAYVTQAEPFAPHVVTVLRALQAGWAVVLIGYFLRAFRFGPVDLRSRAALADWSVLLLAPLPFSPWLEPHHGVPMILPVALCLLTLFDARSDVPVRSTGAVALGSILVVQLLPLPFEVRGLVYLVQFVVLTAMLAVLRPGLASYDAAAKRTQPA